MSHSHRTLFEPFAFAKGVTLRNRVVMAPMTTWAGHDDGTVTDAEVAYYQRRVNGVGLVVTGCTRVQPNGIGFTWEFASYDDRFVPSLRRLAIAAKSGGAPALLQIYHAGNKAVSALVPTGEVVSASAVATQASPFSGPITPSGAHRQRDPRRRPRVWRGYPTCHRSRLRRRRTPRCARVPAPELPVTTVQPSHRRVGRNARQPHALPLAVVHEVQRVIAAHATRPFLLGYRVSPEEPGEGGLRLDDVLVLGFDAESSPNVPSGRIAWGTPTRPDKTKGSIARYRTRRPRAGPLQR